MSTSANSRSRAWSMSEHACSAGTTRGSARRPGAAPIGAESPVVDGDADEQPRTITDPSLRGAGLLGATGARGDLSHDRFLASSCDWRSRIVPDSGQQHGARLCTTGICHSRRCPICVAPQSLLREAGGIPVSWESRGI
ncbi:hypothetical protein FHR83_005444 [Actinoplanes campanulatus]|uniref:Uncharacterized protein n=1 Tax=Actinoplanes campanulatus TaxID=113559 RepID=A0A7W5AKI4_9ACTN|nr:hypothetical protein [Actinoplanes campanulatus]